MKKRGFYSHLLGGALSLALFAGYTPAAQAQAAPETLTTTIANTALLPTPPVPTGDTRFRALYDSKNGVPPHKVVLLEDGPAALEARLLMIEHAQSSIDIESYIFDPDEAGEIVLQALVRKKDEMAREGKPFRVRILVDHMAFTRTGLTAYDAQALARHGIELKFYNNTISPLAVDVRSHKKTFLVDGKAFITGGRNIENRYFGMDPKYDYLDSDIYVQGWAAGAAQGAFNDFWNSDLSKSPAPPTPPDPAKIEQAEARLRPTPALKQTLAAVQAKGMLELNDLYVFPANSVTYLSDRPYDEASPRRTETWLLQVMAGAKQRLLLENYAYTTQWGFMHDDRRKMFRDLLARGVSVEFLTNSLESRDSPIFFRSYPSEVNLVRKNMVITAVTGVSETPTDDPGLTPQIDQGATWGTHSKTACIDDRDCFVGSANLDPRSEDINAETGVIVNNNPAFAVAVESGIRHRELDAELLERSGNYQNTPRSQMQGDCPHDVGPTGAQIGNMDVLVRTMEDIGASRM